MGGFSSYTYPGGNMNLQTGGGAGGGLGVDDMSAFFKEMAMRRMAQADEDRQRRQRLEDLQRYRAQAPTLSGQANPQDQHLADLQRGMEISKIQHAMRPAPQKMLTGPQINPGWVDDPIAMSGIARQMYLPQGSSMTGGSTGQEEAAAKGLSGEVELDLATEAERRRRAMLGGTGPDRRADYPGSSRGF